MFPSLNMTMQFQRLGCTRTDKLIIKFSYLFAPVAQTFQSLHWYSTWFTIMSKNTMTLLKMLFLKIKI